MYDQTELKTDEEKKGRGAVVIKTGLLYNVHTRLIKIPLLVGGGVFSPVGPAYRILKDHFKGR